MKVKAPGCLKRLGLVPEGWRILKEMSLKGLLSSRIGGGPRHHPLPVVSALSDSGRLAMLDELEQSGLSWFWASDANGLLIYLSPGIATRIGAALDELIGQPLAATFIAVDHEHRGKSLPLMLGARKAFTDMTVRCTHKPDGVVLRLSGQPVLSAEGDFTGFRGTGTDITAEFNREAETARLARFDSLTGLSNRHRMAHQLEAKLTAFKAARRNCAVMMLDLDRFKQVNDTLGHAAGDELLKQVADRLTRALDRDCEIGRLGGDEFQVLLPDMADRGVLGELAMKIIAMMRQPFSLKEGRCVIGATVGIAIAPHDGVTRDEIVRAADLALYAAKNGGRGQYRFFSGELENETIFRRRLEENLGAALKDEELFLRFEPIVEAASGYVRKLEAHVCWQHGQRGEIDAEEFAAILQRSSHAADVGLWAIRRACHAASAWPDTLHLAVAVSNALFQQPDFVAEVAQALHEAALAPERLNLEISEAVFSGDNGVVERALSGLIRLGVRLTLDDFGSGCSSLGSLRRAPYAAIRLNQAQMGGDEHREAMIGAVVSLANALHMDTMASGIECAEQLARLTAAGVRYIQGPIVSEPLEEGALAEELSGGAWKIEPGHERTHRARRRTVFRKIQVIHEDYAYEVTLRNLSKTGALIQGLTEVPTGTQFVVDLGGGQLAVATVTRSSGDVQGLEFEQPLVEDGAGSLCTRHRVSPYALASAGAPLAPLAAGSCQTMPGGTLAQRGNVPQFAYAKPVRSETP